jgi:hypothetical protein
MSVEKKDAEKLLMDARNYYEKEFNRKLDDEVLLFFISASGMTREMKNEMKLLHKKIEEQKKILRNEITLLPKIYFRNAFDYFLYGMGQIVTALIIAVVLLLIVLITRFKHAP